MLIKLLVAAFLVWLAIRTIRQMKGRAQLKEQGLWVKPLLSYTVPQGSHTIKVYTYDGRPLEGVPLNTPFELEVIPGISNMQSVYTHMNWTGIGGLRYQGKQIGFMTDAGTRSKILSQLAERHGSVFVHANIRGYDREGGWPLISVRVPSTTELKKLR